MMRIAMNMLEMIRGVGGSDRVGRLTHLPRNSLHAPSKSGVPMKGPRCCAMYTLLSSSGMAVIEYGSAFVLRLRFREHKCVQLPLLDIHIPFSHDDDV